MKNLHSAFSLFFLLFSTNSISLSNSANSCGQQVSDFLLCLDKQSIANEAAGPNSLPFDEFQKKISSCFTSNGCKDIKLESEENIEARHGLPPAKISSTQHLEDCKYKVYLKARSNVEKCAAKSIPDLVLPPSPVQRKPGVGLPLTITWAAEVFIHLRSNATCPSSAKLPEAEKCLHDVFEQTSTVDKRNAFDSLVSTEKTINSYCKANCFAKINVNNCKNQPAEGFKTICNCVDSDLKTNFNKYDSDLAACLGNDINAVGYNKSNTVNEALDDLRTQLCLRVPEYQCNGVSFADRLKALKAQAAPKMRR